MCFLSVMLPEEIRVHDPSLARLGLGPHPFDVVHQLAEISRHKDPNIAALKPIVRARVTGAETPARSIDPH